MKRHRVLLAFVFLVLAPGRPEATAPDVFAVGRVPGAGLTDIAWNPYCSTEADRDADDDRTLNVAAAVAGLPFLRATGVILVCRVKPDEAFLSPPVFPP